MKRNKTKKTNYKEAEYRISKQMFYATVIATSISLVFSVINLVNSNIQYANLMEQSKPYFVYTEKMGDKDLTYDNDALYDISDKETLEDIVFEDVKFEIKNVGGFVRNVEVSIAPYLLFAKFDEGVSNELEEYYCRIPSGDLYRNYDYEEQVIIIESPKLKYIYYCGIISHFWIRTNYRIPVVYDSNEIGGDIECIPVIFFLIKYTDIYGNEYKNYYSCNDGILKENDDLHNIYAQSPYNECQFSLRQCDTNIEKRLTYIVKTAKQIIFDDENWHRVKTSVWQNNLCKRRSTEKPNRIKKFVNPLNCQNFQWNSRMHSIKCECGYLIGEH